MNKKSFFRFTAIALFSTFFVTMINFSVLANTKPKTEVATIAGGCFWSMETIFQRLKGVISVYPGYAGGFVKNPSYEEVCTGKTGHAEAIQVTFDPTKISYAKILDVYWHMHNPTTLNKQGNDEGTQYRSAIFYNSKTQKDVAEKAKLAIAKSEYWGKDPIVTEITPFTNFYKAENYHKDYYNLNPNQGYCAYVIEPKVAKLKSKYRNLLK